MWVALSPFFGGAKKQKRDSSGVLESDLTASDKPTITRFSASALNKAERTVVPIFGEFIVSADVFLFCTTEFSSITIFV